MLDSLSLGLVKDVTVRRTVMSASAFLTKHNFDDIKVGLSISNDFITPSTGNEIYI